MQQKFSATATSRRNGTTTRAVTVALVAFCLGCRPLNRYKALHATSYLHKSKGSHLQACGLWDIQCKAVLFVPRLAMLLILLLSILCSHIANLLIIPAVVLLVIAIEIEVIDS